MKIKDEVLADLANMMINAKKKGVNLQIISAFRDLNHVKSLWGSDTPESNPDRLKTLAPPGFSEHHTGYVVDFNSVSSNWWASPEGVKTYNWLEQNATRYNFEQSFTRDYSNSYGIMEEKWHWRWVGSNKAKVALRKNIKLPEKVNNVFPPPIGKTEAISRLTLEGVKTMTDAGAAITLVDKDGNRFIHYDSKQSRSITVREAARLQSFEDDFDFIGSQGNAYQMIGNAVPPRLAKAIGLAISDLLNEMEVL